MEKKLPTIEVHGKEYVLVKDRILAFHELHKKGSIVTEITINGDSILARSAVTTDDNRLFTGHSEAVRGKANGITGQSPVEVAETSAVGRALGMLGIGILESVASADEVRKVPQYDRVGEAVVQVDSTAPKCKHGPMRRVQTKKPGANQGRWFYSCPQPQGAPDKCDSFVWEDEWLAEQQFKDDKVVYDEEGEEEEKPEKSNLPF